MVAELVAVATVVLAGFAELLHAVRCRRVGRLAFGPGQRPRSWASFAPVLRVFAITAAAWGLTSLLDVPPKAYVADSVLPGKEEHILIVLDVSPSMRLEDAGPEKKQPRRLRARDIMESFFRRVPTEKYRVSVLAVYNGAKPVVIDTKDVDVVRAILGELPLFQAFEPGKTRLFDGLEQAAEIAKPWNPKSTTLVLISDGDTVPSTGMPRMPASIGNVLVLGVGDSRKGSFIDGRQSRQDVSTLRQIAARLRGTYHNGNEKHISSDIVNAILESGNSVSKEKWTRREYALLACGIGSVVLAFLPILLHYFGTGWQPGVVASRHSSPMSRVSEEKQRNSNRATDAVGW